ncbi:methylosome subunit pICln-like [Clytia hemisphaerica]|uniref:methylosome subunit pICln-like n=1 Tax=Clytia hemisphaerica TaxID=252671 RepID=UPI0034D3DFF3
MVSHPIQSQNNIVHNEENVSVYYGEENQGKGSLEINENVLEWKNESKTLKFNYISISLHAISRETSKFPHECIYCLVDSEPESTEENRDPENPVSEVRFVPDDNSSLQVMYDAITTCQELHPDPNEEFSEEENEDDQPMYEEYEENAPVNLDGFYTAESNLDDVQMSEEGLQILQRLQQNMVISSSNDGNSNGGQNDQFQDAEE